MKNVFVIFLILVVCDFCTTQNTSTPKEYLNYNKVNSDIYSKDSTYIQKILYEMITNNIPPFTPKSFDVNTMVFVDTLLYSPDQRRLAIWVITKNSNSKLLYSKKNDGYYYNGNCMYASRNEISNNWRIHERSFFELVFFSSPNEIIKELFHYSFQDKVTFKRKDSFSTYNLNDIRFWTEITWEESILNTPTH